MVSCRNLRRTEDSLVALPAKQEMWIQSLRQEDPLEKEMATHSSTIAWKIPWTEEPGDFAGAAREAP